MAYYGGNIMEDFESVIKLMNEKLHKLECDFLSGKITTEEYMREKSLIVSNTIGYVIK